MNYKFKYENVYQCVPDQKNGTVGAEPRDGALGRDVMTIS